MFQIDEIYARTRWLGALALALAKIVSAARARVQGVLAGAAKKE